MGGNCCGTSPVQVSNHRDSNKISATCPPCTSDDMARTKSDCQDKGVYLEDSEITKNSTIVCAALHGLFECVAENIPQCLETIGSEYDLYTYKPWNCVITDQHISRYQEIVLAGCSKNESSTEPLESRDQFSYKLAQQNNTSIGVPVYKQYCWTAVSMTSLVIIFQINIRNIVL